MSAPWLSVIGIGEDGVEGLSATARALIGAAAHVVGGVRHLKLAERLIRGETCPWPVPLLDGIDKILRWRGRSVVVLASGDPLFFGVGSTLARYVEPSEMLCLPVLSSVSLACARLGWARQDVRVMSLCGRPLETLAPVLQPGARLIILSADAGTPLQVANFLQERGFGSSELWVLEALGGPSERVRKIDPRGDLSGLEALNLLALRVRASTDARVIPLSCGLPDDLFEHDGQLTKREIRAVTLSSLMPRAGALLWDVGAGAGSVSIEWMLCDPACRAIAIERDAMRVERIARNAAMLGVPDLQIESGSAPEALLGLERPDAVFVGGAVSDRSVFEQVWVALKPSGRLVANAVTLEGERMLTDWFTAHGGTLTRLGVERLDGVGRLHGYRPAMRVTQLVVVKS